MTDAGILGLRISALGKLALGTLALGTLALGTLALGTLALGTLALGTLALGTLALGTPGPWKAAPGATSRSCLREPTAASRLWPTTVRAAS
jgi:hypothetical protein